MKPWFESALSKGTVREAYKLMVVGGWNAFQCLGLFRRQADMRVDPSLAVSEVHKLLVTYLADALSLEIEQRR